MALPDYNYLYDHACERKGGEKALKALLPKTKSTAQLKKRARPRARTVAAREGVLDLELGGDATDGGRAAGQQEEGGQGGHPRGRCPPVTHLHRSRSDVSRQLCHLSLIHI